MVYFNGGILMMHIYYIKIFTFFRVFGSFEQNFYRLHTFRRVKEEIRKINTVIYIHLHASEEE